MTRGPKGEVTQPGDTGLRSVGAGPGGAGAAARVAAGQRQMAASSSSRYAALSENRLRYAAMRVLALPA
ncbi:hypothetical protein AcidC75_17580 [Acidisoma sp. C75]